MVPTSVDPEIDDRCAIWSGPADVPDDLVGSVVTIGVFDGMHRGHAVLVDVAVAEARERGVPAVLVTFDPHPAGVLGLTKDCSRLCSIARRAELAGALGIDAVFVVEFDLEFARHTPQRFIDELLVGVLKARAVVVGENFTFGHRAEGTVQTMSALGEVAGFSTHAVALVDERERVSSSSRVRALLRQGDIGEAARVLGRPYGVTGRLSKVELEHGAFVPEPGAALPGPGLYFARVVNGGCVELTVTTDSALLVQGPLVAGPACLELELTWTARN